MGLQVKVTTELGVRGQGEGALLLCLGFPIKTQVVILSPWFPIKTQVGILSPFEGRYSVSNSGTKAKSGVALG